MQIFNRIGAMVRGRRQEQQQAYRELVEAVAEDDPSVEPDDALATLATVGLTVDHLAGDVALAEARREAVEVVATLPSLKAAVDAAGKRKAETTERHFRERREIEERHRQERNRAATELDAARSKLEYAREQEKFLAETAGNDALHPEPTPQIRFGTVTVVRPDRDCFLLQDDQSSRAYEVKFRDFPEPIPDDLLGRVIAFETLNFDQIRLHGFAIALAD